MQGSSLLPRPDSDAALFVFLGIMGLLIAGYILGSNVARLFRRPQIRFFRTHRTTEASRRCLDGTADASALESLLSPGISSRGEPLKRVQTCESDRGSQSDPSPCVAFLEGPFVAFEDLRRVVPVSQGSQRIAVGQPAIKVDFAIIPMEVPKDTR